MSERGPGAAPSLQVTGARVAVVAARFNESIVDGLLTGARAALTRHGVSPGQIEVVRVPGAWELPLAAAHLASQGRFDAVLALGAVIRGDTPHFDYVCSGCSTGLMQVQLEFGIPVGFGVLTCDDAAQARKRSAQDDRNKGADAAIAVLGMIELLRRIDA